MSNKNTSAITSQTQKTGLSGETTVWYSLSGEESAKLLAVDPAKGLSAAEAQPRLQLC